MPSTTEEKVRLRRRVREQLAAMEPEELRRSDDALFARFLALPQVERAGTIFAFWGIPGREPETARLISALLERGKRVCLPRMLPGRQMEARLYDPERPMVQAELGVWEPDSGCPLVKREDMDLILVPALCYDRQGYRLGFGGGYYDRWLAGDSTPRVGLCRRAVASGAGAGGAPRQPGGCAAHRGGEPVLPQQRGRRGLRAPLREPHFSSRSHCCSRSRCRCSHSRCCSRSCYRRRSSRTG